MEPFVPDEPARTLFSPPVVPGRGALACVVFILFLDILGLTILSPVLPYIVRRYSEAALTVTLMTVVYSVAQFFAAPLLGLLSDRYGRRPVLLFSILSSAVGYLLFGIGGALWVLFLSRLIDGFMGGNVSTAVAYIADISPPAARVRNFGLIGLAFGLGFVLGPALGGFLSRLSLSAPAFAAAILSLCSVIAGYFTLPESLSSARRAEALSSRIDFNPFALILSLIQRPSLRIFFLVQTAFLFAFTGVNSILPVFLIDTFQARPLQLSVLFALAGLGTAGVQSGILGKLTPRYGEKRLALIGLTLLNGCYIVYLLLMLWPDFRVLYPINMVSGGSSAMLFATLGALIANHVADHEQGKAAGVNAALTSLITVIGPLWAGACYDYIGPSAPFWSGVLCLTLTTVMLGASKMRVDHASEKN